MNNARRLLAALDTRLDTIVELTLYGRAALSLGFDDAPKEFARSRDIDGVLWIGQAERLAETSNFWDALQNLNEEFKDQELYISHLFEEDQLILSPDWKAERERIIGDWNKLSVFRLSDKDMFLTKLMRDDPLDRADATFIVRRSGWDDSDITKIISDARFPEAREIREQFASAAANFVTSGRFGTERVTLDSSAIEAVTFDASHETLDVEFRGGTSYRYYQVPSLTYRELLVAESAGAFWNKVKDKFTYVRLLAPSS